MLIIAGIVKTTGFIQSYTVKSSQVHVEDSDSIYYKDFEVESTINLFEYYYNGDRLNKLPNKPSDFYVWNLEKEVWVYSDEIYNNFITLKKEEIVVERNTLLLSSDWTELPSAFQRLGESKVAEWQLYRQQLRDITTQEGYPFNVIWPTQPV